jgi:hypothetical protein
MELRPVAKVQGHIQPSRGADEDRDLGLPPCSSTNLFSERRYAVEARQVARLGEMIDRKHRMGLAAAEGRLQADDGITTIAA